MSVGRSFGIINVEPIPTPERKQKINPLAPSRLARINSAEDRICANNHCSKPFESSDPRKIYCQASCATNPARRALRDDLTRFRAIDGEGIGRNEEHRYVLLGIGQEQLWHEDARPLYATEIFRFLYARYEPRVAYVGFYLGYDFTQWIKNLKETKARSLITAEGRERRRINWKSPPTRKRGRTNPGVYPVDTGDWQVDCLWPKKMMFRPDACGCESSWFCKHPKYPWMTICDAGPFFQKKFIDVINPDNWTEPVVPAEVYDKILEGKSKRATAELDEEMMEYNRLENWALEQVMPRLDEGFRHIGVKLTKGSWFGPGQVAQNWLRGRAPGIDEVEKKVPKYFRTAAAWSFFGGWFELMIHGIIPGISHEYDINNAYPYIASQLPCLLHGKYSHGKGKPPKLPENALCLVNATVFSPEANNAKYGYVGAMLHRTPEGHVNRPMRTRGWFWSHELQAAVRAKLVRPTMETHEWAMYEPCDCPPPLRDLKFLYQMRLDVGKKTPIGVGAKLAANSVYGKLCQSVGNPQFGNPVYASLITAGCRTMITDAIASHPGGKKDVAMVATDGIYFLHEHPSLPISDRLGDWSYSTKANLTLFRPGFYWDDNTRREIRDGDTPRFKARGINAVDFANQLANIDETFRAWDRVPPFTGTGAYEGLRTKARWPEIKFHPSFMMVSALSALWRKNWNLAGKVSDSEEIVLTARPDTKRRPRSNPDTRDINYNAPAGESIYTDTRLFRTEPMDWPYWDLHNGITIDEKRMRSTPYEKRFGMEDPFSQLSKDSFGITPDGPLGDIFSWAVNG